jgi:hypothetical protein
LKEKITDEFEDQNFRYIKEIAGLQDESDRDVQNVLKQKFHAHEVNGKLFGLKRKKRFQTFFNSMKSAVIVLHLLKDLLFVLAKISVPIAFFILSYYIWQQILVLQVSNILPILATLITPYVLSNLFMEVVTKLISAFKFQDVRNK